MRTSRRIVKEPIRKRDVPQWNLVFPCHGNETTNQIKTWGGGTEGRKDRETNKQNGRHAKSKSASIISPYDRRPSADGLGAIIIIIVCNR